MIATAPAPTVNLTYRPGLTPRGLAVIALIRACWFRDLPTDDARRDAVKRLWIDTPDLTDADLLYLTELTAAHQD